MAHELLPPSLGIKCAAVKPGWRGRMFWPLLLGIGLHTGAGTPVWCEPMCVPTPRGAPLDQEKHGITPGGALLDQEKHGHGIFHHSCSIIAPALIKMASTLKRTCTACNVQLAHCHTITVVTWLVSSQCGHHSPARAVHCNIHRICQCHTCRGSATTTPSLF